MPPAPTASAGGSQRGRSSGNGVFGEVVIDASRDGLEVALAAGGQPCYKSGVLGGAKPVLQHRQDARHVAIEERLGVEPEPRQDATAGYTIGLGTKRHVLPAPQ